LGRKKTCSFQLDLLLVLLHNQTAIWDGQYCFLRLAKCNSKRLSLFGVQFHYLSAFVLISISTPCQHLLLSFSFLLSDTHLHQIKSHLLLTGSNMCLKYQLIFWQNKALKGSNFCWKYFRLNNSCCMFLFLVLNWEDFRCSIALVYICSTMPCLIFAENTRHINDRNASECMARLGACFSDIEKL